MKDKNKNMDLLVKLVSTQSSVSEDREINELIESYLRKIDGVSLDKDSFGNIYATKGGGSSGYKCIVAHTDTVHTIKKDRKVYIFNDILFAMAESFAAAGSQISQTGIGGDDRSGIYAAIRAMMEFDDIKAVFFRFEETGCKGSRAANMKFFDDCNFVVQLDRRGSSDFITFTNGIKIASDEFINTIEPIYKKFGFKNVIGVSTDVGALKGNGLNISACNISAGYYSAHSPYETINVSELNNAYDMVCEMFTEYGDRRFEHKYERPVLPRSTYKTKSAVKKRSKFISTSYFDDTSVSINKSFYEIVGGEAPVRLIKSYELNNGVFGYKFIDNDMIDMDKPCPVCGQEDVVAYLTSDCAFTCMASSHSDWVIDKDLYKDLSITENDKKYVYNRIYDIWLLSDEAKWDEVFETYIAI